MAKQITNQFRLAVGQLNSTVGDIQGNCQRILDARKMAEEQNADLLLMPELFLSGYPTEDLVQKKAFVSACQNQLEELSRETDDEGPGILVGAPSLEEDGLYNGMFLLDGGRVQAKRFKVELPNYGVFDEKRLFKRGPNPGPMEFRGMRIGVPICEDMWFEEVPECLMETGAEILLVPNASPYCKNRVEGRLQAAISRVVETGLPLVYVNQVCGHDELVFDGGSFALNPDRTLSMQLAQFEESVSISDWQRDGNGQWICREGEVTELPDMQESNWRACVLGLKDYVTKNGFPGVVLGLSGGIDSAVCAAMAVDALGPDKVRCVMLPYKYTSRESLDDASEAAEKLGVECEVIPIEDAVTGLMNTLSATFSEQQPDVTEENMQSRIRGTILMAISNKFGPMVLTTGNKSENSVGYATLYGDMNGGFNPIKDLYKTEVYELAAWRNRCRPKDALGPSGEVIPQNIIDKAPTAELREGQTDQETLPPYGDLDDILECLVDREMSLKEIEARGHDRSTVQRIENLLYVAEYKRRQAAPGVRISEKNFGRDRRYPIVNKFRDRL